mmetsp:Transcript_50545/g.133176  ORF Transcript_50545/g.133176 Transcript_50545/m.133176 type:complete len:228 (+) Transcript_50545:22-705(+)
MSSRRPQHCLDGFFRCWATVCSKLPGIWGIAAFHVCCGSCRRWVVGPQREPLAKKEVATYEAKVLVLGLDGAGKTKLLWCLENPGAQDFPAERLAPTKGFNSRNVDVLPFRLTAMEVGGDAAIRPFWNRYATGVAAAIFVVDGGDAERFQVAAKSLLEFLCSPRPQHRVLVVVTNVPPAKAEPAFAVFRQVLAGQRTPIKYAVVDSTAGVAVAARSFGQHILNVLGS